MKNLVAGGLATAMMLSSSLVLATTTSKSQEEKIPVVRTTATPVVTESTETTETTENILPKYVFMFIGDGMSYPQIQATSNFLGAMEQMELEPESDILKGGKSLSFMDFNITGSATVYDSTSFAPDSASTATSLATGEKTHSGVINMDETLTTSYETIAEKVKDQLDYKVGVVTSVTLNHATPAAYYAHQESRNNYYEIGLELIESDFDYFGGGGFNRLTGAEGEDESLLVLAEEAGYNVILTQEDAENLKAKDGKSIVIGEGLEDGSALPYAIDVEDDQWQLADFVEKGIEMLYNDTGFFFMVEGGKIDWAGHANDAGSVIGETLAFSHAVEVAIDFYNEYPEDTLIIVTGDHETGGLTIGFAGTDYDVHMTNLANQTMSYQAFDENFVKEYKENHTSFADVLEDIEVCFGLTTNPEGDPLLLLTSYELDLLKTAYFMTIMEETEYTQQQYLLYGGYEPLSVTVTHLLNNKSGINFASYAHTGIPVGVFAQGAGEELFSGYYDNTDIFRKLASLLDVE